jgi:hypothetical protein
LVEVENELQLTAYESKSYNLSLSTLISSPLREDVMESSRKASTVGVTILIVIALAVLGAVTQKPEFAAFTWGLYGGLWVLVFIWRPKN